MGWRFRKNEVVKCTELWQTAQKHLWHMTCVVSQLACISDQSVASSSVHLSYKNHHPSSHFFAFCRKHIVRASPSSLSEIPICLPYKSEKCYYEGVDSVGVYEQVLKASLRFPLNSLHRELLKYLGLSINQISLNAWKVFIAMKVLYGDMSNGARSLTVREFLHCYRPDEIDKSKRMYSFVPRKSVLKVIYETPDSNRDWKSCYFFLEGDCWMCHPGETDYMSVDKTWGILDLSCIHTRHIVYVDLF